MTRNIIQKLTEQNVIKTIERVKTKTTRRQGVCTTVKFSLIKRTLSRLEGRDGQIRRSRITLIAY